MAPWHSLTYGRDGTKRATGRQWFTSPPHPLFSTPFSLEKELPSRCKVTRSKTRKKEGITSHRMSKYWVCVSRIQPMPQKISNGGGGRGLCWTTSMIFPSPICAEGKRRFADAEECEWEGNSEVKPLPPSQCSMDPDISSNSSPVSKTTIRLHKPRYTRICTATHFCICTYRSLTGIFSHPRKLSHFNFYT